MSQKNITDLIKLVKDHYIAILSCSILVGLAGFLYGTLKQPRYTACSSILISEDTPASALSLLSQFSLGNLLGGSASVDNEELVINSHDVFTEVVRNLGLNVVYKQRKDLRSLLCYPSAPVMVDFDAEISDTLMVALKFNIKVDKAGRANVKVKNNRGRVVGELKNSELPAAVKTDYGVFNLFFTDDREEGEKIAETISIKSYSAAAEDLEKEVKIGVMSKRADAISLELNHVNPYLGKLILSGIIDAYNGKGIAEKQSRGHATIAFIDSRIAELSGELAMIENDLSNYKRNNNLTTIENDVNYSFQEHAEIQKKIIQQEAQLKILETIRKDLESAAGVTTLPDITLNDKNVNSVAEYNALLLRRKDLSRTAKEGNIALKQLDDRIDALRQSILLTVEQNMSQLTVSLEQLRRRDALPMGKMGALPNQEKQLREIMRNREIQEQIYIFLLEEREQQAMNTLNSLPRGIVIDQPYILQKPAGLSTLLLTLLGLFAGSCIATGYFYMRAKL